MKKETTTPKKLLSPKGAIDKNCTTGRQATVAHPKAAIST